MDDKYKYFYENDASYCYPNTNILKNKLNIKDDKILFEKERQLVSLRTAEILENPVKGNFDFEHLKNIHRHLFQDIFEWAGKIRMVDIAKTDLFCLAQHIDNYATDVFGNLVKKNYFLELDYDAKLSELVNLFADINALHPFREGNGRTQREFIEELAKVIGVDLDLTVVSQEDMIIASHDSINGSYDKFLNMFRKTARPLSKEEQLKAIDDYIKSNELKNKIKNSIE